MADFSILDGFDQMASLLSEIEVLPELENFDILENILLKDQEALNTLNYIHELVLEALEDEEREDDGGIGYSSTR